MAKKLIEKNPQTREELESFKRAVAKSDKIAYPRNVDLLNALKKYSARGNKNLKALLRVRPIRSLSGIVNVSVLTKPYPCPGTCLYCPQEPGFPKSYLSGEPAAQRAWKLKFDPFQQVARRLETLAEEGHSVDKVELRVIGGTWSYYPAAYQKKFVTACFFACNNYAAPTKRKIKDLETEQKINETAKCRIIGLSVETRPDFIDAKEIIKLRKLGVTKVELGIQSIYDDVLEKNRRGHKVSETIRATKLLKDAGFKVSYQVMLNLYGSSTDKDVKMMEEIFSNPDFQPDLLKIYPCAILPEAPLYHIYKEGKFKPYSDKRLVEVIKTIKKKIPPYVRIERIIRDIPSPRITTGTKTISNLRQIIEADMKREGWQCQCIRCREVKESYIKNEKVFLITREYPASDGKEIFLSFENINKTKIFSLLRLRLTSGAKPVFPVLDGAALIREIHTYGLQVPVAEKGAAAQHKGLGKQLIKEAEKIAEESGYKKIVAISGIGARDYWRKSGYKLSDSYMVKLL